MKYDEIRKAGGMKQHWITTVDGAEYEALLQVYSSEIQKKTAFPGFRKGKAPLHVVAAAGGKSFYSDAAYFLLPAIYNQAVSDNGFEPVADPDFQVISADRNSLSFITDVNVFPDVTLADYKGLTIACPDSNVTDEEIEAEVAKFRDLHRIVNVTGQQKNDDDLVYFSAGVEEDGKPVQGMNIINSPQRFDFDDVLPELKAHLAGCKTGDSIEYTVAVPEDFKRKEIAGKTVSIYVKVGDIKERVLPELNDELFASYNTGCKTVDEYRAKRKNQLSASREEYARERFEENLKDVLAKQITANIPREMVDKEAYQLLQNMAANLNARGSSITKFAEETGTTTEDIRKNAEKLAIREISYMLAIDEICRIEGIDDDNDAARNAKAVKIIRDNAIIVPEIVEK